MIAIPNEEYPVEASILLDGNSNRACTLKLDNLCFMMVDNGSNSIKTTSRKRSRSADNALVG